MLVVEICLTPKFLVMICGRLETMLMDNFLACFSWPGPFDKLIPCCCVSVQCQKIDDAKM